MLTNNAIYPFYPSLPVVKVLNQCYCDSVHEAEDVDVNGILFLDILANKVNESFFLSL